MNTKKAQIIESAIHLFATEGFHPTSIQDICTNSGISKGAFYLHFSSKDELLLKIYQHYYENLHKKVEMVKEEPLEARESFEKQLEVHYREVFRHRDFIIMQLQEQELSANLQLARFVRGVKSMKKESDKDNFIALYGEKIRPFIFDLSIILEGINKAYLQTILYEDLNIEPEALAAYIVKRIDDVAESVQKNDEWPFVTSEVLKGTIEANRMDNVVGLIDEINNALPGLDVSMEKKEEMKEALAVLRAEVEKENPKKIIIQGMLSTMGEVDGIEFYCKRIAHLMNVGLND